MPPLHNRPHRQRFTWRVGPRSFTAARRSGRRVPPRAPARGRGCFSRADAARCRFGAMATQRKNRRAKSERRSGADRRNEQAPVELERRKGTQRRTGLERRLDLETAGDQIHAALGLLTYALDQGILLDVDRWLLETAVARLRLAVEQLGEKTDESP